LSTPWSRQRCEQRARGFSSARLQRRQFAHQDGPAQATGAYFARRGTRFGAMRRTERIHDVDVAESGHFLREIVASFFSPLLKRTFSSKHHSPGEPRRRRASPS